MVIVSDPNTLPQTVSPISSHTASTLPDKLRPAVVNTIDEILLNALIKIPNLQQVILPHVSCSYFLPVVKVHAIGFDERCAN